MIIEDKEVKIILLKSKESQKTTEKDKNSIFNFEPKVKDPESLLEKNDA